MAWGFWISCVRCPTSVRAQRRWAPWGEQLHAPDSWSTSLACGLESVRHATLFLCYILFHVLPLKSYFLKKKFQTVGAWYTAAIFTAFLWAESCLCKRKFFRLCSHDVSVPFLPRGHGSDARGLSHLGACGHFYVELEFSNISLLGLPAAPGSLLPSAESPSGGLRGGVAQCKTHLASSTTHSWVSPLPLSCFFSPSPIHVNTVHACTHTHAHRDMQCHINEWIAWR